MGRSRRGPSSLSGSGPHPSDHAGLLPSFRCARPGSVPGTVGCINGLQEIFKNQDLLNIG